MCGICGVFIQDKSFKISQNVLKQMTNTMKHRGPDDEGFFVSDFVGLGHRRLSIIDVKRGHQPIYNEDKSKVIIFNGEIYNYLEIKEYLEKKHHKFVTDSDTEVILHLYEELGTGCVEKLRGMFAFAIYDIRENSIFLARDRLGLKPLYYLYDENKVVFGSEIKAILAFKNINKEIDYEALSDYLTFLYIPAPKSIFKHIRKLPAGHWIFIKDHHMTIQRYWDIDFSEILELSENEWIEGLYDKVQESVRIRLMSEVPLGSFLSGGIDSSVIVAMMSDLMGEPVITNSIGFSIDSFNELAYAKEVSDLFSTDHHEYTVEPDCIEILEKLAWHFDEPFADSSALPTYYVSKMAKENVTVALSGDGGDENFAGYRRYYFDVLENSIRKFFPATLRKYSFGLLGKIYPKADWLPQIFRAKTLFNNISLESPEAYFSSITHFNNDMDFTLLSGEIKNLLGNYSSYNLFQSHYQKAKTDDLLTKIQYTDIKTYLVDDILTKVDRTSMAHSLEVRVPLIDHELMEYIAKMPSKLKLRGKQGKFILKKMARSVLPEQIITRKKMGFSIPIDNWFRTDLRTLFEDEVLLKNANISQYLNLNEIRKKWNQHQLKLRNFGVQFWTILMLEKWAQNFLKS